MIQKTSALERSVVRIVVIASLFLATSCGGPANKYDAVVTGTVKVDGELAKSGSVTFHPVTKGSAATGQIKSDGSYSLRTGQGDMSHADGGTIASGDYLVTASITGSVAAGEVVSDGGPQKPGPSLIDANYSSKATTELRHTVKPGTQVIVLEFKGTVVDGTAKDAAGEAAPQRSADEQIDELNENEPKPGAAKESSGSEAPHAVAEPAAEKPAAGSEK